MKKAPVLRGFFIEGVSEVLFINVVILNERGHRPALLAGVVK